jgi:S-adenosylmethionine:tRNA-ribosyltransferase-isomerase (queuine synthetase)
MLKHVVVAAVLIAIATPALAAEFYIGLDPQTKKCKVVETKPDGQTMIMVGTTSYATKEEAKAAKKATAECKKQSAN